MSGGISAIKGFEYQAMVILDRLFEHFDQLSAEPLARPEGEDDLDLIWTVDGVEHRRYEQIKKPREDRDGNLKPTAWTLAAAIDELLPGTVRHLAGNSFEQVWVLGDKVSAKLNALVTAGAEAPNSVAALYWTALHGLARDDSIARADVERSIRKKLLAWRVPDGLPADAGEALSRIVTEFADFAMGAGAADCVATAYRAKATQLYGCLADVLARTKIRPAYGTEAEVAARVFDRLERNYALSRQVVENTLFRNLLGFINEVAKQPGRRFDRTELEFVLRSVWPHMVPVRKAPPLAARHIARRDLTERFTMTWTGKAIEAIGISGSGKTSLAAEVAGYSRRIDPKRWVYYAAVRGEITLRDVLVGVAFQLRSGGIPGPFAISVETGRADEEVLTRLARAYSALPQKILLLVDLVDGTCTDAFAHDLATFIRAMSPGACRVAVFGQESTLREFTPQEQDEHGVNRLDIRGLRFEEFATLVGHYHPDPDRAVLWDIFQRVTAGRAAGLFAKLADSLARTVSLSEMSEMAAKPAGDILARAEQQRFARLDDAARHAAEKLVCFALPFRRKDAEEIFPEANVGAAMPELLTQGLLQPLGQDLFEMHETVRAGLEGTIALNARRSAHAALAAWYAHRGLLTAEILHLEKAGRRGEAESRAREAFLRGERWSALAAYVTGRKLVSAEETIKVISDAKPVDDKYLLSSILRGLGEPIDGNRLLQVVRDQPERFMADYQWGLAIVEAVLDFDPERLHDLIAFAVEMAGDPARCEAALNWLLIAARRRNGVIGRRTIEFFKAQLPETKRLLLRFLMLDRRRQTLREAFEFFVADPGVEGRRRPPAWCDLSLQIGGKADAVEFLAALPARKSAAMITAKSALLGPLSRMVWAHRETLRAHCIEVLREGTMEDAILVNAIRVLVFLAEPSVCTLCEPLMNRNDAVGSLAKLVPALVPALCDHSRYEGRLLDRSLPLEERFIALFVLAAAGADLSNLYVRVKAGETDPKKAESWDFWFLMLCAQAPFAEAIPLLDERLKSADGDGVNVLMAALAKLGELAVPAATQMLIRALSHPHPRVRQRAAAELGRRRSRVALSSLADWYAREEVEVLAVGLAAAVVASGPSSVAVLQSTRNDTPATRLWQCILAMRARDLAFADRLVTLANERAQNWQLRRAAIFAAGRLPYEAALEKIVPVVMAERSALVIDGSPSFRCHAVMSSILLCGANSMAPIFARGRGGFVAFFGDIFESSWKEAWSPQGLPSGVDAAGWLFDRLTYHGWPGTRDAPDSVLNEINIPMLHSAVLRSLRLCGRPEMIDEQLAAADHVWLAMKCLLERSRIPKRDPRLAARLRGLVDASLYKGNAMLGQVIAEIDGGLVNPPRVGPMGGGGQTAGEPSPSYVSYDDVVRVLSGGVPEFKPTGPLVLEPITAAQCERLILMADPVNDPDRSIEYYDPSVEFTQNGHVVARRRVTYTNSGQSAEALIRPAVAAANAYGLLNPWHKDLLRSPLAAGYVPKYLACLGARSDGDRFYDELANNEDVLLPLLCNVRQAESVLKYVDARMVPFLTRYVSSGTDELFEGLCTLTLRVDAPEIDAVLAGLLYRWVHRFNVAATVLQHDENDALWRGFNRLTEHPRFTMVKGWQSTLASVLAAPLSWFRAENIVRVLERDPRSYILIESRLFKAANWEHFHWDEIDRLDDAGERLFCELLEE